MRGPAPGGAARASVFPVLPASSMRNVGVHPLLDAIVDLLPSPVDRGEVDGHGPRQEEPSHAPARAGRAVLRLRLQDHRRPPRRAHHASSASTPARQVGHARSTTPPATCAERVGHLELLQGKNADARCRRSRRATSARWPSSRRRRPATPCATRRTPSSTRRWSIPEPATTFAIEPKTRGDEDKISAALHRLMEEDPVLQLSRDAQTHEMLLSGMGQLHIEVVVGTPAQALQGRGQPQEAARSPTGRRSRARPRATAATRSRPAATASSATARSA